LHLLSGLFVSFLPLFGLFNLDRAFRHYGLVSVGGLAGFVYLARLLGRGMPLNLLLCLPVGDHAEEVDLKLRVFVRY